MKGGALLAICGIMWSFVGILVKAALLAYGVNIIIFSRFFFGVIFLIIFLLFRDKKISFNFKEKWIYIGGIGKSVNYILENMAITLGSSYIHIMGFPIAAVFTAIASVFLFKEKMTVKKIAAMVACMSGVILMNYKMNGAASFAQKDLVILLFLVISCIGMICHVSAQKALVGKIDGANMNLSMFSIGSVITAFPLGFSHPVKGAMSINPTLALVLLGVITGLSFVLYSTAIKTVSIVKASIITNISVILALVWAQIFYHEAVTVFTAAGSFVCLAGIILINLPDRPKIDADAPAGAQS